MKNLRSTFRMRFILVLVLCIILALGSFWLAEIIRKDTENTLPPQSSNVPDYYVDKFNYVQLTMNGQPRYNVKGDRLIHHPADDSFDVTHPIMHSLDKTKPPMTLYANNAKIEDHTSKVHLYDNVNAVRPKTAMADSFHLQSEYLLVLPNDNVIQTDKPVAIMVGQSSVLNGTGMHFNNTTRELKLLHTVHGVFHPAPR